MHDKTEQSEFISERKRTRWLYSLSLYLLKLCRKSRCFCFFFHNNLKKKAALRSLKKDLYREQMKFPKILIILLINYLLNNSQSEIGQILCVLYFKNKNITTKFHIYIMKWLDIGWNQNIHTWRFFLITSKI